MKRGRVGHARKATKPVRRNTHGFSKRSPRMTTSCYFMCKQHHTHTRKTHLPPTPREPSEPAPAVKRVQVRPQSPRHPLAPIKQSAFELYRHYIVQLIANQCRGKSHKRAATFPGPGLTHGAMRNVHPYVRSYGMRQ